MSIIGNIGGFGTVGTITTNQPIQIDAPPPNPNVTPTPNDKEQTGRQLQPLIDAAFSYGQWQAQFTPWSGTVRTTDNASTYGLQMNAVGIPAAIYANWNIIRDETMVEIGRAVADAIISNAQLVVEGVEQEDAEDEALTERVEKVRQMWSKLWPQFLAESAYAKDDGNHTLEVVYGHDDEGWQIVSALHPLAVQSTLPLVYNDSKTFAGVRNYSITNDGSGQTDIAPEYCIRMVYQSKAGNLYGRSRFMAIRRWVQTKWGLMQKLSLSGESSIGNLFDISYPVSDRSQSDPLFNTETAANRMQAENIGMAAGKAGFYTRPTLSANHRAQLTKIGLKPSDLDPWQVNLVETKANAFGDFKAAFDTCDEQILLGMCVLPQAIKEGDNSGARAVAGTHTETMVAMANPWLSYLCGLLQEKTDLVCELNEGKAARGTVRVYGVIDDETVATVETIMTTLLSKDLNTLAKVVEIKPLLAKIGFKPRDGFDQDKMVQDADDAAKAEQDAKFNPPMVNPGVKLAMDASEAAGHWITIGAEEEEGGGKGGGAHVFIRDGVIEKGPANLTGAKLSDLKKSHSAEEQGKPRQTPKPAHKMTRDEFINSHQDQIVTHPTTKKIVGVQSQDGSKIYKLGKGDHRDGQLTRSLNRVLGDLHTRLTDEAASGAKVATAKIVDAKGPKEAGEYSMGKLHDSLIEHAKADGVLMSDAERESVGAIDSGGVHEDALEGLTDAQKGRVKRSGGVSEDAASNATSGLNAADTARHEKRQTSQRGMSREEQLQAAVDHYKNSPDPKMQFAAWYAENGGGMKGKQMVKVADLLPGTELTIGGEPFKVEMDNDENIHLVDTTVEFRYAAELGKIPVDKGSIVDHDPFAEFKGPNTPAPAEDASKPMTGKQRGLLGERFDGSGNGSVTKPMFGDVSRDEAPKLTGEEAKLEAWRKQGESGAALPGMGDGKSDPQPGTIAHLEKHIDDSTRPASWNGNEPHSFFAHEEARQFHENGWEHVRGEKDKYVNDRGESGVTFKNGDNYKTAKRTSSIRAKRNPDKMVVIAHDPMSGYHTFQKDRPAFTKSLSLATDTPAESAARRKKEREAAIALALLAFWASMQSGLLNAAKDGTASAYLSAQSQVWDAQLKDILSANMTPSATESAHETLVNLEATPEQAAKVSEQIKLLLDQSAEKTANLINETRVNRLKDIFDAVKDDAPGAETIMRAGIEATFNDTSDEDAAAEIAADVDHGAGEAGKVAAGESVGDVVYVWVTAEDDRVCPRCGPLDGKVIAPDEMFTADDKFPPVHPRCRCVIEVRKNTIRRTEGEE